MPRGKAADTTDNMLSFRPRRMVSSQTEEVVMVQKNTPELFVRDVDEAVRFYTEVLGFTPSGRVPEDRSQPTEWAMVESGAAAFMFEKGESHPDGVVFYLAVESVDQAVERVTKAGAAVHGPADQWYGMREATVTDPNGYKLVLT